MQDTNKSRIDFVETILPWIVAGVALLIYLITLNRWVTVASLPLVAKITNWDSWTLTLQAPVFYIVTYPFRFLPVAWQPILLNIFSAVCAAATLGLLARIVAMLPQDRTHEQRQRERSEFSLLTIPSAWLPPVFAVLVMAFQLTFWENATACTGEMLNLLIFAYVIRCMLEYRLDEDDRWIYQAMFVYALGITNNYAMIAFIPMFLGALVWMMGWQFFRLDFLLRLFGITLAGLAPYLVLPAANKLSQSLDSSYFELFRMQFGMQKNVLLTFPKYALLLCGLTSLLPVFVIGFRWPSSFGDVSVLGVFMTNLMFRVIHGIFLVICTWVMLDPPFSPRALGFGFPFLPLYFLSAICVGYFSGYFLLVFGYEPEKRRHHTPAGVQLLNKLLAGLVWLASIAVPAGLVYQNWSSLQANNGPQLAQYGQRLTEMLPKKGAVLMSDDPLFLLLVEAATASQGAPNENVLLDTRSLGYHVYHRNLNRRYGQRWPDVISKTDLPDPMDQLMVLQFMLAKARSNAIYYLHPPCNYYIEGFQARPRGVVYELQRHVPGIITNTPLTAAEITNNLAFWQAVKSDPLGMPRNTQVSDRETAQSDPASVAKVYSRAANVLGVELQMANHLEQAGQCFELARELNADNLVAAINVEYNRNLRNKQLRPVELTPDNETKLRQKYRSWMQRWNDCGPFDEPRFCAETGEGMATWTPQYVRQAAQQFIRVQSLNPGNMDAQVWLANLYLKWPMPERTLEVVQQMRDRQAQYPLSLAYQIECLRLDAWAYAGLTNWDKAVSLIMEGRKKHPDVASLPETLSYLYVKMGQYTNALTALEDQLRLDPNNTKALLNKGALNIQLHRYAEAVRPLSQVLESDPQSAPARMNRAIAQLRTGQWDDAKKDYEVLLKLLPAPELYRVYYGLGEIYNQQKDFSKAVEFYEKYLKDVPRNSQNNPVEPEETILINKVQQRLKEIRK